MIEQFYYIYNTVRVLNHLMSLEESDQMPFPVVVHLGYLLQGRLMAILIQGDAQLVKVMLHRQQRFQ